MLCDEWSFYKTSPLQHIRNIFIGPFANVLLLQILVTALLEGIICWANLEAVLLGLKVSHHAITICMSCRTSVLSRILALIIIKSKIIFTLVIT